MTFGSVEPSLRWISLFLPEFLIYGWSLPCLPPQGKQGMRGEGSHMHMRNESISEHGFSLLG